ncbi:MAG: hypothetical protein ACFFDI_19855, partial [Promethearchaeota archaeon]
IISSVINFSDPMPLKEMQEAENHTLRCDLMIVIGTSLTVYPANNFPKLAKKMGAKLIIINAEPTPLDNVANLKLEVKIGQFLLAVIDELKKNLKENRKD